MGVYSGPTPKGKNPYLPLSREEQVSLHCLREAKREVQALCSGEPYEWQPLVYRRINLIQWQDEERD